MCVHEFVQRRVYVHSCVCVCVRASPQPLPSIIPQHSLHQCCHKIMWQGVNHAEACGATATRGFSAEHFCEQHQGEGNSRDCSTGQTNLTTARSHTSNVFFPTASLWPLESSNHSLGLNPDPCKKEPSRGHMQTKCSAMPSESHSRHLVDSLNIHPLSVPRGLHYTID